jgi:hypothetical protein
MPFGGMPADALLHKLEETDPELVEEVRGFDEFHDVADDYDNYARSEIIDWTPDTPFLESDHTRRDPSLSRSQLNLRYNGTRGSNPELPHHPELFIGFMGDDPRGVVNEPRFDQFRGHTTARAANLTARMGDNDDHAIAERPWTNQSISYGMKELLRRAKKSVRVFSVQKDGRPVGRNAVANPYAERNVRAATHAVGAESMAAARERFAGGDYAPSADTAAGGVRGVDAGHAGAENTAPWRHTTGDADLGVQQYGAQGGAGRATVGAGAQAARFAAPEQDWAASQHARAANRQTLGATMAAAARYSRAVRAALPDQDAAVSHEAQGGLAARLRPAADVARVYRYAVEDQARRPATEVQDGETLGAAIGLRPGADPGRAARAAEVHVASSNLANVAAIVTGLREGTASSRRLIANHIVAAGARHLVLSEGAEGARRGVAPGADYGHVASLAVADGSRHLALSEAAEAARRGVAPGADYGQVSGFAVADGARHLALSEGTEGARRGVAPGADYAHVAKLAAAPLIRAAAAEGLVVHTYKAAPQRAERRIAAAQGAYDDRTWLGSRTAQAIGRSRPPGEWRSATQAYGPDLSVALGDDGARVFGLDAEDAGAHGAAPVGPKSLRAGGWSDGAGLIDADGDGLADALS